MKSASEDSVVQKCKKTLTAQYGKRFKGLILYGSIARSQAEETSDIDISQTSLGN